jgi:LysR family carnitine catabolism transcriptional activator
VHREIAVKPRYEVEQVPTAVALVEAGLGVTALPALTFAMFKGRGLAVRQLSDPVLRRNVGFLTRQNRKLPSFAEPLKRMIADNLRLSLKR